jgi:hypothetical protein
VNGSTRKTIIRLIVYAGVLVLVIIVFLPKFFKQGNYVSQNACVNNLAWIAGAKKVWASEKQKTTNDIPTWKDLQPYASRFPQPEPQCPSGGIYTIGKVDESPTCSIGGAGHTLNPNWDANKK